MYDHARLFDRLVHASTADPSASLRSVSRRLGVHPHTLTAIVRKRTGASYSSWRAHRQVSSACRLLRTRPELSIKEVAAASGFSATSVFDRFLRRACGQSPSDCRRLSLGEAGSFPREHAVACADLPMPRRSVRSGGSKVNVLVNASTIDRLQPPPPDGTLDIGRRVLPNRDVPLPDVTSARRPRQQEERCRTRRGSHW